MKATEIRNLVLQALEHEMGGVKIYTAAVACAMRSDLSAEWQRYLEQTLDHVEALRDVCGSLGIDPEEDTPLRRIVRHNAVALLEAIGMARENGDPAAAQIVAAECIVLAETKDHLDWKLLGLVAANLEPELGDRLARAYERVEGEEDEHLYHTKGWCRELWIEALGLPAVLPPAEEVRDVRTAIGAARAEAASDKLR
ncbi:MAG: hypothetical protein U0414_39920 [Polyangiaceae bacterium]